MPYKESKLKGKIREIRNSSVPVIDGISEKLISYEVEPNHYQWLLEQADKVDRLEKENRQLKDATQKLKDTIANDVFAVLSNLPK